MKYVQNVKILSIDLEQVVLKQIRLFVTIFLNILCAPYGMARGTKYMDFKDWCKVLDYFEQGNHMENKEHIVKIKSQMNQLRTVYNWDHLQ